jgi:hypothetical protein
MTVKITTNNVPREILDGWELTAREREDFDYLNWVATRLHSSATVASCTT